MKKNYTQGTRRLQLFRSSMSLPGAKVWAFCPSTKSFNTYIPNREFCDCLQFYCQVALFEPCTRCPRKKCGVVTDVFSDHLSECEHGSYRIWRCDSQAQFLSMDLAKAARHPIVEPHPKGQHSQRPDIKAISSHRGKNLFDSTISHPLSFGRLANTPREASPLPVLNEAWAAKFAGF